MKHIFFFFFIILLPSRTMAESITLQTYYPAPTGSYNTMKTRTLCIGSQCTSNETQANDNNLFVQGNIGIGNALPEVGLHVGDINPSPAPMFNLDSINDMIVSRNLWVQNSFRARDITTSNSFSSENISATDIEATNLTASTLTLTNNSIQIPTNIPENYVLASNGNGTASWKDPETVFPSNPGEILKGTLCGFTDTKGTKFYQKCQGHEPWNGSCPSGYTATQIAQIEGTKVWSCVKN